MTRRLFAAPPDVLRWSPRSQGHGDCTVAALELACGVTYETALAAALAHDPDVLRTGMLLRHVCGAAKLLGFQAEIKRKYSLEDNTGILSVHQPRHRGSAHVVYLWEGRIIEPMDERRQLWLDAEQFLKHYRCVHDALIIMKQEGE
jgi:hypothetical protein